MVRLTRVGWRAGCKAGRLAREFVGWLAGWRAGCLASGWAGTLAGTGGQIGQMCQWAAALHTSWLAAVGLAGSPALGGLAGRQMG